MVSTVPTVSTNVNPAIALSRYGRTIVPLPEVQADDPMTIENRDLFNIEYAAYV